MDLLGYPSARLLLRRGCLPPSGKLAVGLLGLSSGLSSTNMMGKMLSNMHKGYIHKGRQALRGLQWIVSILFAALVLLFLAMAR